MSYDHLPTRRQLRETQRSSTQKPRREPNPHLKRTIAKKLFSGAALLFSGLLIVGMSVPASAFLSPDDAADTLTASVSGQSLDVSTEVVDASADRATFKVSSYAEVIAKKYGTRSYSYSPTAGPIRWPFPYSTSITDGFGERVAPCRGCSTFHKGIDFTPGENVPTYAIAAGVVESSVTSNGGLGNEVIINHVIKGQAIQSVYGHLAMKSSPLKAGDTVKPGDLVGLVGRTGTTTGANMHLEIHVNGVAVDPFAWLTTNAR